MKTQSVNAIKDKEKHTEINCFSMYKKEIALLIKGGPLFCLLTILTAGLNICFPLIVAYLMRIFVEVVELKKMLWVDNSIISLAGIAIAIFVIYFISSVLSSVLEPVTYKTMEKIDDGIKNKLIGKLHDITYSEFENTSFLDDLYKASDYSADVMKKDLMVIIKTGTCIVSLAFICGILFKYSVIVLVLLVVSVVFSTFLSIYWEKLKLQFYNETVLINRRRKYCEGCIHDMDLIHELRSYNAVPFLVKKYEKVWDECIAKTAQNERRGMIVNALNRLTDIIGWCLSYYIVGTMCVGGTIDISEFIYLASMILTFKSVLKDTFTVLPESKKSNLALHNYNKIIFKSSKINDTGNMHIKFDDSVMLEFKNVSFKYPAGKEYVLKEVSFTVEKNSLLGIVGPNGAGKSTLMKLILGLYEPTSGEILINGKSINEIPYEELIEKCSVIFQDYSKYATTLKENIYLGNVNEEMNDKEIKLSGQKSGIETTVRKCKNGWSQELTKRLAKDGIELSGGEWQRLALAKAFYKNTELIMLDEPTASLDPHIEHDLFSCMNDLNKTRIIISHRLGNMIYADKILLLNNKTIEESGTHDELMSRGGEYAKMFNLQAANYQ